MAQTASGSGFRAALRQKKSRRCRRLEVITGRRQTEWTGATRCPEAGRPSSERESLTTGKQGPKKCAVQPQGVRSARRLGGVHSVTSASRIKPAARGGVQRVGRPVAVGSRIGCEGTGRRR